MEEEVLDLHSVLLVLAIRVHFHLYRVEQRQIWITNSLDAWQTKITLASMTSRSDTLRG